MLLMAALLLLLLLPMAHLHSLVAVLDARLISQFDDGDDDFKLLG